MKLKFSQQIFENYSTIKVNENPSSWNQLVPCGQTDGRTDGRTDVMKLIDVLLNFANAPKILQKSVKTLRIFIFLRKRII